MRNVCFFAAALVFALASLGHAMPLGLQQQPPDVTAVVSSISYDATTHLLTATGFDWYYTTQSGIAYDISGGDTSYALSALVDNDGNWLSGTIDVNGDILGLGIVSPLLTSTTLIDFGFVPDGTSGTPTFEFLFASVGGNLAPDLGGWPLGVFLIGTTSFPGDFHSNFTLANATADNFMMAPEPATTSLLVAGLLAMAARRGRWRGLAKRP